MNQDPLEYSEYLDLMPAYRSGRLSPVEAHRVARLLEQDPIFRKEAERDRVIGEAMVTMPADPLPRDLVERSVQVAVGDEAAARWLSLDSILLALGVGVGGAAAAQFLGTRLNVFEELGSWVGSQVGIALGSGVETAIGVMVASLLAALGVVGALAYRLIRAEE